MRLQALRPTAVVVKIRGALPARAWKIPGRPILSLARLSSLIYFWNKRKLGYDYSFTMPEESTIPIDIYMPTLEKDAKMLQHAIDYAREYIKHPITNIYIVAADKSTMLREIAKKKGCIFVNEDSVIDMKKSDINYSYKGYNKNGWIYKMLLNLNANKVCTEKHILVLDSDTIFIAPQIFVYKNKPLFNLSIEYHQPYFDANQHIVGVKHKIKRSFITHYMIFDADVLKELHKQIEEKWSRPWYRAIIEQMDRSTAMAFADYECYGDFYMHTRPGQSYLNFWSNVSHEVTELKNMQSWIDKEQSANMHRSLSFHTFKKEAYAKHEQ